MFWTDDVIKAVMCKLPQISTTYYPPTPTHTQVHIHLLALLRAQSLFIITSLKSLDLKQQFSLKETN